MSEAVITWNGKEKVEQCLEEIRVLKNTNNVSKGIKTFERENLMNVFLIGDNCKGLCFLDEMDFPSADLVYIDPPYQDEDMTTEEWLNSIYLRIKLASRRMNPDALICISINDRFQAELRIICNEIFGRSNFLAQIVRKRTAISPQKSVVVHRVHEYVLIFAKNIEQYLLVHTGEPVSTMWDNMGYSEDGYEELRNLIGKNLFPMAKPVKLIKKCISFCPKKNAVILDFYAGSGTTAQAVMELNQEDGGNRSFQLIQRSELLDDGTDIVDIALRRINAVDAKCQIQEININ